MASDTSVCADGGLGGALWAVVRAALVRAVQRAPLGMGVMGAGVLGCEDGGQCRAEGLCSSGVSSMTALCWGGRWCPPCSIG